MASKRKGDDLVDEREAKKHKKEEFIYLEDVVENMVVTEFKKENFEIRLSCEKCGEKYQTSALFSSGQGYWVVYGISRKETKNFWTELEVGSNNPLSRFGKNKLFDKNTAGLIKGFLSYEYVIKFSPRNIKPVFVQIEFPEKIKSIKILENRVNEQNRYRGCPSLLFYGEKGGIYSGARYSGEKGQIFNFYKIPKEGPISEYEIILGNFISVKKNAVTLPMYSALYKDKRIPYTNLQGNLDETINLVYTKYGHL